MRKAVRQSRLQTLGAAAQIAQLLAAALRAGIHHDTLRAAVMATQAVRRAVKRQVGVTALAMRHPAAIVTHGCGREATTVEEQQRLLLFPQGRCDGAEQSRRAAGNERSSPDIDNAQGRMRSPLDSLRQTYPLVASPGQVVEALQRGRG